MSDPSPSALAAIRAWYRLQRATTAFGQSVRQKHGIAGEQLALLRIVAERDQWELGELRERLTMHPATLGQALDRLAERTLLAITPSTHDRRRRTIRLTGQGRRLLTSVPLIGPVRLRTTPVDDDRLQRLTDAFEDAVLLFGLEEWAS